MLYVIFLSLLRNHLHSRVCHNPACSFQIRIYCRVGFLKALVVFFPAQMQEIGPDLPLHDRHPPQKNTHNTGVRHSLQCPGRRGAGPRQVGGADGPRDRGPGGHLRPGRPPQWPRRQAPCPGQEPYFCCQPWYSDLGAAKFDT